MRLIVCLDDKNGMLFCGRRQSRDRVVCEKIVSLAKDNKLWMNAYSAKLFGGFDTEIETDGDFLRKAAQEDFCFVENQDITPYIDKIDRIFVFKWNRRYPADKHFPIDVTNGCWKLSEIEEFAGYSHEKITMEMYTG